MRQMQVMMLFFLLGNFACSPDDVEMLADCGSKISYFMCACGHTESQVSVPVEMCLDEIEGKITCQPCNNHLISDMCAKLANCETCLSGSDKCLTCPKDRLGPWCDTYITRGLPNMYLDDGNDNFPIRVKIARGAPLRDNRILRGVEACPYPANLTSSEVDCTLYNTKIKCTQTCVWGYNLPEGLYKDLSCRYDEGIWSPSEFEECKPYVDCSLKFKFPGDMFCTSNKIDTPTTCSLTCNEYDDIPATPEGTYTCTLNGDWKPSLPFCIEKAFEILPSSPAPL